MKEMMGIFIVSGKRRAIVRFFLYIPTVNFDRFQTMQYNKFVCLCVCVCVCVCVHLDEV